MKDSIIHVFRQQVHSLRELVESIDEDQIAARPTTKNGLPLNPPAWQVGHVTVAMGYMIQMLGGQADISEDWYKRFTIGSTPSDQLADYPSRGELFAKLTDVSEQLAGLIVEATPEQLAAANPIDEYKQIMPTIGDALLDICLSHVGVHIGQMTCWRRAMGMKNRF